MDKMELGKKKWPRLVQNSSRFLSWFLAEVKISPQKKTCIQGNILHPPKMNYLGVFMGYLAL